MLKNEIMYEKDFHKSLKHYIMLDITIDAFSKNREGSIFTSFYKLQPLS